MENEYNTLEYCLPIGYDNEETEKPRDEIGLVKKVMLTSGVGLGVGSGLAIGTYVLSLISNT